MNATMKARRAYSAVGSPMRSARSVEYEAVARITHRMREAALGGRKDFPALVAALRENKRLWTIFLVDLADSENGLPPDLKARLIYLAEFTFEHTSKVLARKESVAPLLEVNAAIMRGLRNKVG
ncbi:MAG: flagellar biosynthesis regulator FlaF [Rhodobacteraceae bacterium]|nr:flagellar biosynthesis regulator FlaF [Paracoccaceae bacterium]